MCYSPALRMNPLRILILSIVFAALAPRSLAQAPGAVDATYHPTVSGGNLFASAVQGMAG